MARLLLLVPLLAACKTATPNEQWDRLIGREWILKSMEGQPVLEGTAFSLTFGGSEKLYGLAINHYNAPFTRTARGLEIGSVSATRKFLDQPRGAMAQESRYFELLGQAQAWRLRGDYDVLELLRDGKVLLYFER